jgi:uroporphyrin-3 C-methyltransferase
VSVAALAGSGYLYQQQRSLAEKINSANVHLGDVSADLKGDLEKSLQNQQQKLARIQQEMLTLKRETTKVYTQEAGPVRSWEIEEIKYLLRLASELLALTRNIDAAESALRIADRDIAKIADPSVRAVRQQISTDLASLQQVERVDVDGTLNRIRAVERAVDRLPLTTRQQTSFDKETPVSQDNSDDSSLWRQISDDIADMVRIQRIDQPVKPLLPPQQQYFLRENIKTSLLASRIALMQGDRQAYTDNLDQAGQWIRQHFNTSKRPVEWVLNEIALLAKINPSPTLPDISGSFHSLQQLIDGKNQ